MYKICDQHGIYPDQGLWSTWDEAGAYASLTKKTHPNALFNPDKLPDDEFHLWSYRSVAGKTPKEKRMIRCEPPTQDEIVQNRARQAKTQAVKDTIDAASKFD